MIHFAPRIEKVFRQKKKQTGFRWRLDETYGKIKGQWKYLYRAVDKEGNTIDFLLTAKRDKKVARRFLAKAIGSNGKPSPKISSNCFQKHLKPRTANRETAPAVT